MESAPNPTAAGPRLPPDGSAETEACLRGERLWGDDLDADGIAAWYADEEQAYREMKEARVARGEVSKGHQYNTVNRLLAFDYLGKAHIGDALAVGGYDGSEMKPLWSRLDSLTVLDPAFGGDPPRTTDGLEVRFESPAPSGVMRFEDASFDLTTALSVLHHVPNVSTVLSEMVRVTRPGGHILVREPLVSMGDFTKPRPGLTPHERGLPLPWLNRKLADLPVEVVRRRMWRFPVTPRVAHALGVESPYNSRRFVALDVALTRLTQWNLRYQRTNALQKLSPGAIFLILKRR